MYPNFRLDPLGEITRYPCSLAGMARECYSRQPSRSWGALQREGDRGDWGMGRNFWRRARTFIRSHHWQSFIFSKKYNKNRLAAGLHPDPMWELISALP